MPCLLIQDHLLGPQTRQPAAATAVSQSHRAGHFLEQFPHLQILQWQRANSFAWTMRMFIKSLRPWLRLSVASPPHRPKPVISLQWEPRRKDRNKRTKASSLGSLNYNSIRIVHMRGLSTDEQRVIPLAHWARICRMASCIGSIRHRYILKTLNRNKEDMANFWEGYHRNLGR